MALTAILADVQTEKAFQKQPTVSIGKIIAKGKKARYWKNVGLDVKTPNLAIRGNYIDKKCPWTGNVSIRGRVLEGMCVSNKMKRTIVIRRHYLQYVRKYNRFEKRHKNVPAHCSPCFEVKEGDIVTVGQCRPLSKTVNFNVLKVQKNQIFGAAKKQFMLF